jgi:hypothetical protein
LNAISGSSGASLAAILKRKTMNGEINYGCRGRIDVSLEMLEGEIGPGL